MGNIFRNEYPYTDFHELNADWMLSKLKEFDDRTVELNNLPKYVDSAITNMIDNGTISVIGSRRKIVLVGDSYSIVNTDTPDIENGWIKKVKELLSDDESFEIYGHGLSGARFSTLHPTQYIVDFNNTIAEIDNPSDVTDVVVLGGYNDYSYTESDILSGILNFANGVNTKCPNAKIHIGFVGWRVDTTAVVSGQTVYFGLMLERARNAYRKAAAVSHCCYIDGMENIMHFLPNFNKSSGDTVHPNTKGINEISWALVNYLRNGNVNYTTDTYSVTGVSGSMVTIDNPTLYFRINNGNCELINQNRIVVHNNSTWAAGVFLNELELINFNNGDDYMPIVAGELFRRSISNVIVTINNISYPAVVYLYNQRLNMKFGIPVQLTANSTINIEPFTINMTTCEC